MSRFDEIISRMKNIVGSRSTQLTPEGEKNFEKHFDGLVEELRIYVDIGEKVIKRQMLIDKLKLIDTQLDFAVLGNKLNDLERSYKNMMSDDNCEFNK
jgi:hypothetical protein